MADLSALKSSQALPRLLLLPHVRKVDAQGPLLCHRQA